MKQQKSITEEVFKIDDDLKLKEELVGFHAINPFLQYISSSRAYMLSGHFSQMLTLENGDERIIQTGIEKQFGENTFSAKIPNEARIVKVIKRYNGIGVNSVNVVNGYLIIYEDLTTGELDYVEIPYYHSLHQYFGFKYKWNKDIINSLQPNMIVPAGTILADSPSVTKNSGYKYGVNANVLLATLPDIAEDGVVISKELSKKLSYKIFERRVVEFGSDSFPLNIYGDENEYKPFPEIGEYINEDSVVCVLRDYDPMLAPALNSINDVREFNPIFDEAVYVKGPGYKIDDGSGGVIESGKVVDIKVFNAPKFKKEIYSGTADMIYKYINGLKKYHNDIVSTYKEEVNNHYGKFRNRDVKVSNKLHRLLVDSMAISNNDNKKIKYNYRNEALDIYRVEFTIEYTVSPGIGGKITDTFGGKGIIIGVRDKEDMPIDSLGTRADLVMDPSSTISRMNPGRLYEQYFNAMSRVTKKHIISIVNDINSASDASINSAFNTLLGLLELIGNEQYVAYSKINDICIKRDIIRECIEEEVYIFYRMSSDKKAYQVVLDSIGTIYEPPQAKTIIKTLNGEKESYNNMYVAPMYIILLGKTADSYLSVSSSKINHFGFPIGVSAAVRNRMPNRGNPTKTIGETEARVFASYIDRLGLIELKDRANSIPTHEHVYRNILKADVPTNIDKVVDRKEVPYGSDSGIEFINSIFNASGIKLTYIEDRHKRHN